MSPRARLEALLSLHWWRPSPSGLSRLLVPLAWLYGRLAARAGVAMASPTPVPVIVVGNLVVGGVGKTPTVVALVQALRRAGRHPGVVSRGYGRRSAGVAPVDPAGRAEDVGDEPLLLARRTGVPVWVGRRRVDALRALCAAHPEVDVVVGDDGLQHAALARCAEIVVFDERGAGNGLLLPAGPLREPLPERLREGRFVVYNAPAPTTALPGPVLVRRAGDAVPLASWHAGRAEDARPLSALAGRPLLAVAGIGSPERFFAMLEGAGLTVRRLPLPDHHDYRRLPWPEGTTDVVTTEKDAVKIAPPRTGTTRVWVVGLDFEIPPALVGEVLRRAAPPGTR